MQSGAIVGAGFLALLFLIFELERHRHEIAEALGFGLPVAAEIKRLRTEAMAELMEGNERAAMLYTEQADALEGPIAELTVRRFYSPDEQGRVKIIVPTNFQ